MKGIVMKNYIGAGILVVGLGILLPPCFAGKVRAEVGQGADFARYKTYQWLPPRVLTNTGVVENHPVLVPAIKSAVNKELSERGLKEVTEGGDLQVSAGVLTTYIPQLEAVLFAGPQDLTFATPIATMGRYNREGTLVVNLIDTRTKKSAWIGMVQESIDNKPGAGEKKLPSAAAKLFKKYPSSK
jgi:hypothetical protein